MLVYAGASADSLPVNGRAAAQLDYFVAVASPPPGTYLGPAPADVEAGKAKPEPACFKPLKIRSLTLKNRICLSPMAQYHSPGNGMPTDYHLVHYGSFAMRGVAVCMTEATSMMPNGRMTPGDVGIWSDDHIAGWKKVTDFVHSQGTYMGIQINHAGSRAGAYPPYVSIDMPNVTSVVVPKEQGGWTDILSPSGVPFHESYGLPRAMSLDEIKSFKKEWLAATRRGLAAGFDIVELHMAHGYLLHQFMSPHTNKRTDEYGGSLQNRLRLLLELAAETRAIWPQDKPVYARISCSDDHPDGEFGKDGQYISWGIEQSKVLVGELQKLSIDLVDCSSGGLVWNQNDHINDPYNLPHSRALKRAYPNMLIGCCGLIKTADQVENSIAKRDADVIHLARALLRNADFVGDAARHFGAHVQMAYPYQFGAMLTGAAPGPVQKPEKPKEDTPKAKL